MMDEINSPILSIPGISYRMGAMMIDVYKRQAQKGRQTAKDHIQDQAASKQVCQNAAHIEAGDGGGGEEGQDR